MRERWDRATPLIELDARALASLIQPAFPGRRISDFAPLAGGLANTNIRVRVEPDDMNLVVRLYVRDPAAGRKERALSALDRTRTHMPQMLHFDATNAITGHPYALIEWIEGRRLEIANLDDGRAAGAALAGIHSIAFPHFGIFDDDLSVTRPIDIGRSGLLAFLRTALLDRRGSERLGEQLTNSLFAFVAREGALLDSWPAPPTLTHGDFGATNLLIPDGALAATVVDWEFAFSGNPLFDLGNLLRIASPDFERAVHAGYCGAGGELPARWREMARLADLTAWAEFLSRPNAGAALIEDARWMIARTTLG